MLTLGQLVALYPEMDNPVNDWGVCGLVLLGGKEYACGVLAWCTTEKEAETLARRMKKDRRFKNIAVMQGYPIGTMRLDANLHTCKLNSKAT